MYMLHTAIAADIVNSTREKVFFFFKDSITAVRSRIADKTNDIETAIKKAQISPARYEKPIKPDLCFIILIMLLNYIAVLCVCI